MGDLASRTERELKQRRLSLYSEAIQSVGHMTIRQLENLARKIHIVDLKIHSFRRKL